MKNLTKKLRTRTVALLALMLFSFAANAEDSKREPWAVLNALADRIYVLAETTGDVADMVAAEVSAANEIRQFVASGSTDGLIEREKGRLSLLAAAAYTGYPNVVAALLTSESVRSHINDADETGMTPWIAANFSIKQSSWTCNPAVFDNVFKFVPLYVTQPYYRANPTPPYKRTREVLEAAGASSNNAKAKEVWLTNCENQSDDTKAKVQASTDLQKTVQELGAADLTAQLIKLQMEAAKAKKKQ